MTSLPPVGVSNGVGSGTGTGSTSQDGQPFVRVAGALTDVVGVAGATFVTDQNAGSGQASVRGVEYIDTAGKRTIYVEISERNDGETIYELSENIFPTGGDILELNVFSADNVINVGEAAVVGKVASSPRRFYYNRPDSVTGEQRIIIAIEVENPLSTFVDANIIPLPASRSVALPTDIIGISGATFSTENTTPALNEVSVQSVEYVDTPGFRTVYINVIERIDTAYVMELGPNVFPAGARIVETKTHPADELAGTDLATVSGRHSSGTNRFFVDRPDAIAGSQNIIIAVKILTALNSQSTFVDTTLAPIESIREEVFGSYGRGTPQGGILAGNGSTVSVPLQNVVTGGNITYNATLRGFDIPDGATVEINAVLTQGSNVAIDGIHLLTAVNNGDTNIPGLFRGSLATGSTTGPRPYQGIYENDTGSTVTIGATITGGGNTGISNPTGYLQVRQIN